MVRPWVQFPALVGIGESKKSYRKTHSAGRRPGDKQRRRRGVYKVKAKDCQSHQKLEDARNGPPPRGFEGSRPCCHLGFEPVAHRTRRQYISKLPSWYCFVPAAQGIQNSTNTLSFTGRQRTLW